MWDTQTTRIAAYSKGSSLRPWQPWVWALLPQTNLHSRMHRMFIYTPVHIIQMHTQNGTVGLILITHWKKDSLSSEQNPFLTQKGKTWVKYYLRAWEFRQKKGIIWHLMCFSVSFVGQRQFWIGSLSVRDLEFNLKWQEIKFLRIGIQRNSVVCWSKK